MLYYKVVKGDVYDPVSEYTTIKDELVTAKERDEMFPTLSDRCFVEVQVSEFSIVWGFGCRFEG